MSSGKATNLYERLFKLWATIGKLVVDGKRSLEEVIDALQKIVDQSSSITLTSDGTTGEEWITRLKKQNFRLSNYAKQVLRSSAFVPTTGVTYNVVIIKGTEFSNEERTTSRIREVAASRGYATPHPEVACLLREKLSDEELGAMGLWWLVTMHEPIVGSGGFPSLLSAGRSGGGRWLCAYCGQPADGWAREFGFAFVVPQV